MLRMDGWCHESTVLAENKGAIDRSNEFIEVTLTVSDEQVTDPAREVRVACKPQWDVWSHLIPCQVGGVEKTGGKVRFRVAFFGDIPAHSTARFGILYGNPKADPQQERLALYVRDKGDMVQVDNQAYLIGIDKRTGMMRDIQAKCFRVGGVEFFNLTPTPVPQPGVSVQFVSGKKNAVSGKWSRASDVAPVTTREEEGAIYYRHQSVRTLPVPAGVDVAEGPELTTEMLFLASQPFVHIQETVKFKVDTAVFSLRLANFRFQSGVYTHFSFRPVTPDFKHTEVEEIGHILIAPQYTRGLPDGSVMSGFLPLEMPWTALLNISRSSWHTQTRYLLDWTASNRVGYRAATYLFMEGDEYESALMPIYARKTDHSGNTTIIPAGTEWSYRIAHHFSPFEEVTWGEKADAVGRRMNSLLPVQVHPRPILDNGEWGEHPVFTCAGKRTDDYQTSGVR